MGKRSIDQRLEGMVDMAVRPGCQGRTHYDVHRGTSRVIVFFVSVVFLSKRKVKKRKISRMTN